MVYWDFTRPDIKVKPRIKEIKELVKMMDCEKNTVIEIGIYRGTTTRAFSTQFTKVYSLDVMEKTITNLEQFDLTNVDAMIRDENTINLFEDGSIDVVYVDGDHLYDSVVCDLNEFTKKIKKGGYLSGHDYGANNSGVREACLEFFGREPDKLTHSITSNGKNFFYKIN